VERAETMVRLYAVRHGEKERGRDPALTPAGLERAGALATTLADEPITVVFTSDYRRCQETIAPLARARGLEPIVIEAADPHRQLAALHALPAGTTAILCGHANTVPQMIHALGGRCPDLQFGMIPEAVHDRLFRVDFPAGGGVGETEVVVQHFGARSTGA